MALLFFLLTSCGKKEEPVAQEEVVRPVKVMTVTSSRDAFARKYPGKVRAHKRVDLAFQVDGTLIELPIEEGQNAKAGDLLARVDPKDFQTSLRNAEGQLAKAKAALELAQREYERVLNIKKQDPGAISGSMVDQRREGVDRARAEIDSLKAAVDAAKDQLSYTYLRAPFSGVIAKRHVDNFQEVRAKQPIVSLDDTDKVEILVDVPEIVVANIRDERTGKIFAEFAAAPGKKYELSIKEYATRADPLTQTYQVTLQMPQPGDLNVLPGMTATVVVTAGEEAVGGSQFIVPAIAVFSDEAGAAHVWVVDKEKMTVHKRKVKTGDLTGTESIEIVDGLQTDEMIAVAGVTKLREGMKIKPVEKIEF
jgi:multidrug efflux system membrane fusion protein